MKNIYLMMSFILTFIASNANEKIEEIASIQEIHQIKIKIKNYPENTIRIGYYLLDKTYLKPDFKTNSDILLKQADGSFVLNSDTPLESGIYILVFPPNNDLHQFLITEKDQNIEISFDYNNIIETFKVKGGSRENMLFNNYIAFLQKKRNELKDVPKGDLKRDKIDEEVKKYQHELIKKYPNSFTVAIIKSNLPVNMPSFQGTESEKNYLKWQYTKDHFFDAMNLADDRILRTPNLFNKVEYYIDKLHIQHPDSIAKAIDLVLKKMEPSKETYKNYVVHFLNKYAKSKTVGMDAVYVHLVDNYYAKGKTPWVEGSQLNKIITNANALKPTLIGKTAPKITLEAKNGIKFEISDINTKYKVLYFWKEDCANCKSTFVFDLNQSDYNKLKELDAELIAISLGNEQEIQKSWNYTKKLKSYNWLNTKISNNKENIKEKYNITSLPKLFIIDDNNKIIVKQIAGDQLVDTIIGLNKAKED